MPKIELTKPEPDLYPDKFDKGFAAIISFASDEEANCLRTLYCTLEAERTAKLDLALAKADDAFHANLESSFARILGEEVWRAAQEMLSHLEEV